MAQLGKFGTNYSPAEAEESDTFEWFGMNVRITPELNEVELIDFMDAAREIESKGLAAVAALKDGFRMLIDVRDFDEFWRLAKVNRQKVEDLSAVLQMLITGSTDRPTQRPSDSSDGPHPTAGNSPVVSSSPAQHGRPDLQIINDDAAETRRRVMMAAAGG